MKDRSGKLLLLNGCYEALEGGNTAEALIDFTGGVSEPLSLDREALRLHSDQRRALFQTLTKVHEYKSLITCSIWPAEGETVESVLECGLVRGHAYGITAVRKVRLGEKVLKRGGTSRLFMVRMRNPWGTTDWTGAWSQRSEQWQQLSRAERDKMGLVVRDVGEFWMDFEDFCQHFTDVVVCRLVERTLLWPRSRWREVSCYGEWVLPPPTHGAPPPTVLQSNSTLTLSKSSNGPGGTKQSGNRKEDRLGESQQEGRKRGRSKPDVNKVTAEKGGGKVNGVWKVELDKRSRCGGCINHRDTFLHNPQFMFEVQAKEEEVLICLQQEDRRMWRKNGKGENLPIGFEVLKFMFEVRAKEEEVLICLQQEDRRMWRKNGKGENLPIGFEVLKVEVNRCSRVQCVVEQAASSIYMDSRSVTLRGTLTLGRYVVLPTTFLLRLFSHSRIRLR
ncbi:calpain-5 [Maylandia zebra]|uniref:calpain-5 n=1 Tax=Maylandia zebra TaxID=106582 RepID=UPI00403CA20F